MRSSVVYVRVPDLGLLSRCTYAHAEACHIVRRVAQNDLVEEEVPSGIKSNLGGVILKRHLVRSGKRVIGSLRSVRGEVDIKS